MPRSLPEKTPPKPRPRSKPEATARAANKPRATPAEALSRLRSICLALPEVTEGENHSRPCFEVRGKTFTMFMDNHHGDGRLAIWCKAPPGVQAMLVESDPTRFFVPPYVGPRGWVGARLDVNVDWSLIAACVEESYRLIAPKRSAAKRARSPQESGTDARHVEPALGYRSTTRNDQKPGSEPADDRALLPIPRAMVGRGRRRAR